MEARRPSLDHRVARKGQTRPPGPVAQLVRAADPGGRVDHRELAEELGHSPQMTRNTYAHVIDELRGGPRLLPRRRSRGRGRQ